MNKLKLVIKTWIVWKKSIELAVEMVLGSYLRQFPAEKR